MKLQEHIKGLEIGIKNLQQALDLQHFDALETILRDLKWDLGEIKKIRES